MNHPQALLVDDDPAVQMLVSEYLRNLGFQVRTARTLREAREQLEACGAYLMLLDLFLPDGESTELLKELSDRRVLPPFCLVMTAHEDSGTLLGDLARSTAVLQKPFHRSELEACLLSQGAIGTKPVG